MKILFIDTIHPLLKEELEKLNYNCDTAYKKSKSEIEDIIDGYEGIIIRSRFKIDSIFTFSLASIICCETYFR